MKLKLTTYWSIFWRGLTYDGSFWCHDFLWIKALKFSHLKNSSMIILVLPTDEDWAKHESAEFSLIALDLLHLYISGARSTVAERHRNNSQLQRKIFDLLLDLLDFCQPTLVLHNAFSLLRIFIKVKNEFLEFIDDIWLLFLTFENLFSLFFVPS